MIDAHVSFSKPYSKEVLMEYIEEAKKVGIDELYVIEPSFKFLEFGLLYNEIRTMYPCQEDWYCRLKKQSIKEYHAFISAMRKETFDIKVRFGLCISYLAQHEQWMREIKEQFDYDIFIASIDFIDNIAFAWGEDSDKMLWNKYNTNYLYRRYYETMNALLTSNLFDGVSGFDRIKVSRHTPTYHMKHTYHKLAKLLHEHHMYVEDGTSIHYFDHHPDYGLSDVFKQHCIDEKVEIKKASLAIQPKDVARDFQM